MWARKHWTYIFKIYNKLANKTNQPNNNNNNKKTLAVRKSRNLEFLQVFYKYESKIEVFDKNLQNTMLAD